MSEASATAATPTAQADKLPRQVNYIIGNEICERFSFNGMKNILTPFLITTMLLSSPLAERAGIAKDTFHTFVIGVYFFPLLGGWLSDRYFGKYNTVFWFSLIYCAGHACLAIFESTPPGFYLGLFLIALGSGGIKPLVATFMGDQFDQSNKVIAKIAFDAFYWSINFGSFFAALLMPKILANWGPVWAFGIPGLLMFTATLIFWLGRKQYVHVPPAASDPNSFFSVIRTALTRRVAGKSRTGFALAITGLVLGGGTIAVWALSPPWWPEHFSFVISACIGLGLVLLLGGAGAAIQLERARGVHPDEAVDGARAVLSVLVVFALVTPFWSLFDQKASTWVIQGTAMQMPDAPWWPSWLISEAAQMQAINPVLVMLLIPFNNLVLYPALDRAGFKTTPLRRMGWGLGFGGVAWIAAGLLQLNIDTGTPTSIAWQLAPYLLLTFGEVLVSTTGLEFAYSQAPHSMKGVIMSFWWLSITFGNLWVLIVNALVRNEDVLHRIASTGLSEAAFLMFFFAGFAFLAAAAFSLYARRYRLQDYYRPEEGRAA